MKGDWRPKGSPKGFIVYVYAGKETCITGFLKIRSENEYVSGIKESGLSVRQKFEGIGGSFSNKKIPLWYTVKISDTKFANI